MAMTANTDLNSIETLCEEAADGAMDMLVKLGPRPGEPAGGALWDAQDALLKNKISSLTNLASAIGATIVVQSLQNVWPQLDALSQVTASAQANIQRISDINKALAAIASVINFATAAVTLITQPTVDNASNLLAAFKNVKSATT